jgi:hypothetical protein
VGSLKPVVYLNILCSSRIMYHPQVDSVCSISWIIQPPYLEKFFKRQQWPSSDAYFYMPIVQVYQKTFWPSLKPAHTSHLYHKSKVEPLSNSATNSQCKVPRVLAERNPPTASPTRAVSSTACIVSVHLPWQRELSQRSGQMHRIAKKM